MHKPKKTNWRRSRFESRKSNRRVSHVFATVESPTRAIFSGRVLALCCMLAGSSLLYLAGRDFFYYAPVRKCAISFLEGISNKQHNNSGLSGPNPITVNIRDIHIDGKLAIINAGLAIPGNWINTQLYATKNATGNWQIIGVIELDAHVENREKRQLAREIETAFRSSPGIEIKRY